MCRNPALPDRSLKGAGQEYGRGRVGVGNVQDKSLKGAGQEYGRGRAEAGAGEE